MKPGIDTFIEEHADRFHNKRIGIVAHPASQTSDRTWSPDALAEKAGLPIAALFGPEHGVDGTAGAGEEIEHGHHTRLNCPVWSLYGETRKPTPDMLENLDVLIFDLQDISVRCYTYVSTLRLIMEACEEAGVTLLITDRPSPLSGVIDGPMLNPDFRSFVGDFPGPLVYGLTSGEAALKLKELYFPSMELEVISHTGTWQDEDAPEWIAPSPAITSIHAALCYPSTVWVEALPQIDAHRSGPRPFQELSAEGLDAEKLILDLEGSESAGITAKAESKNKIQLNVIDPNHIKPVTFGIHLLHSLQQQIGIQTFWSGKGVREEWFDKLYGTDIIRKQLQQGQNPEEICSAWNN